MSSKPREEHPYIPWWELDRKPRETPESAAQTPDAWAGIGYIRSPAWVEQERQHVEWKAEMQKFFDEGGFTPDEMEVIGASLPERLGHSEIEFTAEDMAALGDLMPEMAENEPS